MAAGIRIEIDDAAVRAGLARLAAKLGDMTPVMRLIGDDLRNDALDNFRAEKSPEGASWPPLSAATLAKRALKGRASTGILKDTGVLRGSIVLGAATPRSVTVGSRLPYAAIHQFGGMAGRGRKVRIPARPYLGLSASARTGILDALADYLGDQA